MSRRALWTFPCVLGSVVLAVVVAGCTGGGRASPTDAARERGSPAVDAGTGGRGGRGDSGDIDGSTGGAGTGGAGTATVDGGAAAPGASPAFILLVTESPPGPDNGNPASWGGVRGYFVAGDGASLQAIDAIPASAVADPVALAFRSSSSEVFVSNRHGNNAANGVAGSISRFTFDPRTRRLTASGAIVGNGLAGVHQAAFNPVTGELFAANVKGGISRFTFDDAGNALPNGVIATGEARGVAVSPDGRRLFVSGAASTLQQFELPSGTELQRMVVGTATTALHYLTPRGTELYVAGLYDHTIHRLRIGASSELTLAPAVLGASNPVSVAFSASGRELFAVGHKASHVLARFTADAGGELWAVAAAVDVPFSGGGALVLPGGAPAVVGPPGSRP